MNRNIPRSRSRRARIWGLVAVSALAAALALPVAAANAAPAAKTYDRCPDGSFCLFSGENGTGATYGSFKKAADANTLAKLGLDGKAKSAWNRTKSDGSQTPKKVNLYTSPTPSGTPIVISNGEKTNLRDKVRSLRVINEATPGQQDTPQVPTDLTNKSRCNDHVACLTVKYSKSKQQYVDSVQMTFHTNLASKCKGDCVVYATFTGPGFEITTPDKTIPKGKTDSVTADVKKILPVYEKDTIKMGAYIRGTAQRFSEETVVWQDGGWV